MDVLEEFDFYVRYSAIKLLSTLSYNRNTDLQQCVLTSPMGITRLSDLLNDKRDIIRNGMIIYLSIQHRLLKDISMESQIQIYLYKTFYFSCVYVCWGFLLESLLLLISLTRDNAEIQKLVTFQATFEKLLTVIEDEEGISGGIIVQDSLSLMHNLLRYNVSNQVSL